MSDPFMFILLIHYLADFSLQTNEQALMKSSCNKMLAYHVGTYSLVWFIAILALSGNFLIAFTFAFITFACHFATDYVTSRIGKPFWEKKDTHNGFNLVGFDQILHYIQLIFTFKIFFDL